MQNIILGQPVTFDVLQGACISVERYSEQRSSVSGGNGLIINGTGAIAPISSETWAIHARRVAFESDDGRRLVFDFPAEFDVEVQDKLSVVVAQVPSGERHVTNVANKATGGRYDFGFDFRGVPIKGQVKKEVKSTTLLMLMAVSIAVAFMKLSLSFGHHGFANSLGSAVVLGCAVLFWGFILRVFLLRWLEKSLRSDARKNFNLSVRDRAIELVGA